MLLEASRLVNRQAVIVQTKTGREVARGIVRAATIGHAVIECSDGKRVFTDRLYDFVNDESYREPELGDESGLNEAPNDASSKQAADGVDVNSLPDGVRERVAGIQKLSDDQVEQVLQGMGDAIVAGLRKIGFSETRIYRTAHDMQLAAKKVLEGVG